MSFPRSVLIVVEPSVIERVTRYVTEPRKRVAVSLELAGQMASTPCRIEKTVALATGISARLDAVVRLRDRAVESHDAMAIDEYAQALWREVAFIGSSSSAVWDQGFGRSLGFLAHPERHALLGASKSTRHLVRAIRYLLNSTSSLAPELAVPRWDAALPAWGGAELASGHVPREFTPWLVELLSGDRWPLGPLAAELFGARSAAEWRDQALAAAFHASRRRGHLLEVDAGVLRARRRSSGVRALDNATPESAVA